MNTWELIDQMALELKPHYERFLSGLGTDLLFTAHSHQAWPDASRDGHMAAWDDAARHIDGKWNIIFTEVLPKFQAHIAKRIGSTRPEDITIAPNTHELDYRLLSCLRPNPKVLTTASEFHSLRRQLIRSAEDGATIKFVDTNEDNFAARFIDNIRNDDWDLIALSYVFFTNARIVSELTEILEAAAERETPVLVDLYHAFNAVPLATDLWPGQVFAVGGGYKYAQSGEGVCWMLLPEDSERYRPRNTGWFADFEHLESAQTKVSYGSNFQRFLGATFEPTPLYRANAVMDWMDAKNLSVENLCTQAKLQTELLISAFDESSLNEKGFSVASPRDSESRANFVSFEHKNATEICTMLGQNGLRTDARSTLLRLGPAPYTTVAECQQAIEMIQRLAV
ncbi:MAG: hypothetical protein VYC39_03170 [Myxococcota bacterium]|nr:hypothetical protein [Myxococcota bacterium]